MAQLIATRPILDLYLVAGGGGGRDRGQKDGGGRRRGLNAWAFDRMSRQVDHMRRRGRTTTRWDG